VELGAIETPSGAWEVEVIDGLAYVADRGSGLRIIDVSNPVLPVELGALDPSHYISVFDVEVVGDLAYLANGAFEVRVVDVSDPTLPLDLGGLDMPRFFVKDVAVADDLVYTIARDWLRILDFGPEYARTISVELDIRPGSHPNAVNPTARGILPIAILGSESFDVGDIDATTLAFGPGEAAPAHRSGGHPEDVNGDGYTDWVSHYRIEEVAVAVGDTELCLTGEALDGTPIEGCDAIVTVPHVGERRRIRVNRQR
jgi:hypothetical protein